MIHNRFKENGENIKHEKNMKNDNKDVYTNNTKHAVYKFLYEIKMRKKEFLSECVKHDLEISSKLTKTYFEIALDRFTCYPKHLEKELIVNYFLINDSYVNYMDILNLKYEENYQHQDVFLLHLNKLKEKNDIQNTNLNTERLSRVVDLQPLELLNYQLSEENFVIKIAKKIMDYLLVNSNSKDPSEKFYDKFFSQIDFDLDKKFTIGELNSFLEQAGIFLNDYDLRYLFESFDLENGRISKDYLYDYITQFSEKNYTKPANTEFIQNENFHEEEMKEERREEEKIKTIMQTNYFLSIIKESLQVLGKLFLLKYFAKYYEVSNNCFYIDSVWLELGYKKLGYKDVPISDMGAFKFVCVKKMIATLKNEMTININLEKLFDFIVEEYKLIEVSLKKDSASVMEEISKKYIDDINEKIWSYCMFSETKTKSNAKKEELVESSLMGEINEFEFRRKFIKNFGFVDHIFFDYMVKIMNPLNEDFYDSNSQKNFDLENDMEKKLFNIEKINIKQWTKLNYNMLLMCLIRNHEKLGLMLEIEEIVNLKNLYNNLENKLFPKKRVVQKIIKNIKHNDKNYIYADDKPKPEKNEKKEEDYFSSAKEVDYTSTRKSINLLKIKNEISAVNIKENVDYTYFDENQNTKNSNSNHSNLLIRNKLNPPVKQYNPDYSNKNKNFKKVNDTASIIPELFELCTGYLKSKFKLDKVDSNLLSSLGCCRIFRDHLAENKIDFRNDVNCVLLMSHIKSISIMSETLYQFLEYYADILKNKNGQINIQYFFMKIEEILMQYSKIQK